MADEPEDYRGYIIGTPTQRTRHDAEGGPAARRCRRRTVPRDGAPGCRQAVTLPQRHWRSYGTDPLSTPAEALAEPFAAFPSWFLRITCDRCGMDRMVNESHTPWRDRALRDVRKRMRHDGRGGLPGRAELLTGIEGASSRPVLRIMMAD